MPEYIYGCDDKTHPRQTIIHGMTQVVRVICLKCGQPMHRIPQAARVNWSTLRSWHPKFKDWYNSSDARREKYYAKQERSTNHAD
jgi:hypothetical protein